MWGSQSWSLNKTLLIRLISIEFSLLTHNTEMLSVQIIMGRFLLLMMKRSGHVWCLEIQGDAATILQHKLLGR